MGLLQRSVAIGLLLKAISFMKVRVLDLVAAMHSTAVTIIEMPRLVLSLEVSPDSAHLQLL